MIRPAFFLLLPMLAAAADISQRIILLEPSEKELAVTESLILANKGQGPAGAALTVSIPDAARDTIQVTSIGPNNQPAQRSAEKAGRANAYKIDFPVDPGETRVDVTYRLPFTSPGKFATRLLQPAAQTRLVAPAGVEIKGAGLELLGSDPRSQARIFGVQGSAIQVEVTGTGSIRAAEAPAEDEDSGPGIQRILPRLYDRVYLVVGLALMILALGFAMLYRRPS